ncbi:MAG: RraA family protein, partial [Spirochaetales bacterium]|nr:RraA family protein [Spirochaetales bacterium]
MDIKELKRKEIDSRLKDRGYDGMDYPLNVPPRPEKTICLDIGDIERVERFKKLYGGCVSDAMFQNGIVGTILTHEIKPLKAHDVIAGRCVPVKWHSVASETHMTKEQKKERKDRWDQEGSPQKKMHLAAKPGTVFVFDNGGDCQAAIFGDLSCNLAKSRGAVGVVNAGLTRDCRMIYGLGDFPYFTRGTTPNAYGGWRVMEVNHPIHIQGHLTHYVIVNPGDFIFGDDDGLQIIPGDYIDDVLLAAEIIFEDEIPLRRDI